MYWITKNLGTAALPELEAVKKLKELIGEIL